MPKQSLNIEHLHLPSNALRLRPKTRGNYSRLQNVVYAEACGVGLLLDVFTPHSPNGFAIVDVVCGAWRSDAVRFNEHLGLGAIDVLCEAGFHVFALRPGSTPQFTAGEMVVHVGAGVRYVLQRAKEFGVEPERYGLLGASAGGHIAALAALTPLGEMPRPAAVGLFFPPTDFLNYGGKPFDFHRSVDLPVDRLLFREGIREIAGEVSMEAAALHSPARNVVLDPPPTYLLHGDADKVVPLQQSERLKEALEAAGGEVALRIKPGGGHPWKDIEPDIQAMTAWFLEAL